MTSFRHRRNIVEEILQKIPLRERGNFHVTKSLIDKSNEQVRILATKCPVGQLGKGDSEETRAAIIFEFVVRQTANHRFSLAAMASAVSMKIKLFRDLHHKIGNYLPNLTTMPSPQRSTAKTAGVATKQQLQSNKVNNPHTSKVKRSLGLGSSNQIVQPVTSTTTSATRKQKKQQDNIRLLSIRLGSIIQDSHGSATRAKELLNNIEMFIRNSTSSALRHNYLHELERNRPVYEAACFYVVSTSTTTQPRRKKPKKSRKKKKSSSTMDDDEEKDNATLSVEDIIRASNISESVFKDILPIVEDFSKQIASAKTGRRTGSRKRDQPSSETASSATTTSAINQTQANKSKRNNAKHAKIESNKGGRTFAQNLVQAIDAGAQHEMANNNNSNSTDVVVGPPSHIPSTAFVKWKQKVLEEAHQHAKERIHETTGKPIDTISYEKAIEFAADSVLRKHQLLD